MTTLRATPLGHRLPAQLGLWSAVALAWLAIVLADATGFAGVLHHHALLEGGVPVVAAAGLFTLGWLVMVAAMMFPASSLAIGHHAVALAARGQTRAEAGFVGGYLVTWAAFGLACFAGDAVIHRMVDATPWLAANSWLIAATTLAAVGAYQFLPHKRRFLEACRLPALTVHTERGALAAGVRHAVDCLGASGPLMLLMFAAGFASVAWMIGLTLLMFYEVRGSHGQTAGRLSGALLIWLALLTTISGSVPGWVGG